MSNTRAHLYLGCISGTSVDGLDIAALDMGQSRPSVIAAETVRLPSALRDALLQLGQPGADDLDLLGRCDTDLGAFIGEAINAFVQRHHISKASVRAIGSHGQTVRHRPPQGADPVGFTLQIGDPNCIVERTGLTTVADFRRRDMAAGGHGAPLAPPFHQALFGHLQGEVAVLNIGGISNVSLLHQPPSGFDTGPGNCLMDSWILKHQQVQYDEGGRWAASGRIDARLLASCLDDPYFSAPPPKSSGREYFNLPWLQTHLGDEEPAPADVQATLCELTARCTSDALARHAPHTKYLIVCGGGRLNTHLLERLAALLPAVTVGASEQWQVDGDSVEAGLFAWLAARTLQGKAGNEPAVTGAADYRVLGAIYTP